jgi:hypothetical protein
MTCTPVLPCLAADTSATPCHDVIAPLSYAVPGTERPRSYACPPPPDVPWESAAFDDRPVRLADARPANAGASLDREGFALWDAPSAVQSFADPQAVTATYHAECLALALAAPGAARGQVFDHLLRRREARTPLSFGRSHGGRAGANGRIHNDYTEASGQRRLELVVTDAHARAEVRRFAIVNIWRPVRGPVLDAPLALCDARTVMPNDWVEAEVVYPKRIGEIYFLRHSPAHRWYYHPAMERHEALVFKQFDSRGDVARFTPHAAFEHPAAPAGAPPRESIEVRCLVVYD